MRVFWRQPEDNSRAAVYAELNAQPPRGSFEGKVTCARDTAKRFLNYLLASLGDEQAKANSHLFLAIHRDRHYWRSLFARPHAQCVQLYLFMRGNVNRRHGHGCFLHFCRSAAAAVAARHHAAIAFNTLPANAGPSGVRPNRAARWHWELTMLRQAIGPFRSAGEQSRPIGPFV
jgi:hypothetical protein